MFVTSVTALQTLKAWMGARAESPRARRWRCVARGARGPARAAQKDLEGPSRKDRAAPRSADPRRRSAPPQCTVHRQPTAPHRAPTGTDRRHRPAPTDRHRRRRRHRAHRVSRFLRCSCETVPTSFVHTRKLCRYVLRLQARPRIAKLRLARDGCLCHLDVWPRRRAGLHFLLVARAAWNSWCAHGERPFPCCVAARFPLRTPAHHLAEHQCKMPRACGG